MHPGFFEAAGPFTIDEIADHIKAAVVCRANGNKRLAGIKPLVSATAADIAFLSNRKYAGQLAGTSAGACILSADDLELAPSTTTVLQAANPYEAFAEAMRLFYADALHGKVAAAPQQPNSLLVHSTARVEEGANIEIGAIVGREANIGRGTTVSAGAIVGYRTVIGEGCYIGAGASVTHAIVGNDVIIHAGARIGQDGFGFAMGRKGHRKIPQIGSVIIEDDVEIGANSTIDRGTLGDTRIGYGTKIDNLVQIAHNVLIGSHCVIVAQSGVAGSAELGDFVVMGAQSGVLGHVKIGNGAQIAGMAHVKDDVAPGARMGGTPARPFKEWAREVAALRALGKSRRNA